MPKRLWAACALALQMCCVCSAADFASVKPSPRVEYWEKRQAQINDYVAKRSELPKVKLLFVGDSITDFWLLSDNPWVKGQKFGRSIWDASFNQPGSANFALNIGISGDRTEHVLYRLQAKAKGGMGQLDAPELNPEFIVLMIGVNNTWAAEEPVQDSVFEGARAVLASLQERKPKARIILQSLLPLPEPDKNRAIIQPVNQHLRALASSLTSQCVVYLDLYPSFVDASGTQISRLFNDGIHPNEDGYRVWRDQLIPFIDRARKASGGAPYQ